MGFQDPAKAVTVLSGAHNIGASRTTTTAVTHCSNGLVRPRARARGFRWDAGAPRHQGCWVCHGLSLQPGALNRSTLRHLPLCAGAPEQEARRLRWPLWVQKPAVVVACACVSVPVRVRVHMRWWWWSGVPVRAYVCGCVLVELASSPGLPNCLLTELPFKPKPYIVHSRRLPGGGHPHPPPTSHPQPPTPTKPEYLLNPKP